MDKVMFEIVDNEGERQVFHIVEGIKLVRFEGDEETKNQILKEAEEWQIIKNGTYSEEDYVHDVKDSGTYTWVEDNACVVSQNGHYAGFVIPFSNVSSYGMSYTKTDAAGLFLTDGRTFGKTEGRYSHCSTEKDESTHEVYSIQRKETV